MTGLTKNKHGPWANTKGDNMTDRIERLFDLMIEHNIEIVSYGLAPNPNGFCFECLEPGTPDEIKGLMSVYLGALTNKETEIVRRAVFN